MAATVYFKRIEENTTTAAIQEITKDLLDKIIKEEKISLNSKIPLKVHFGEKKNVTFLKSDNYEGIIEYLKDKGVESCYMETSVLYGGQRYKKELHEKTARDHGFTQLPIIFADGEHGEAFEEVRIDKKHFKTFKIGKAFMDYDQLIILSHFKGHAMAGFGGALKQLSMGHAAKGGKMAMHLGEKPRIVSRKCRQCNVCKTRCNEDALIIGEKSRIDHSKCVGCGACLAACPHNAITIVSFKNLLRFVGIGNPFIEKLAEGAYAAQKGKRNIYINFAMNITSKCDCEPRKMKPIMPDIGIFVSSDPVAVDKACYDMVEKKGKKFKGASIFSYAQHLGIGNTSYVLKE